MTTTLKTFIFLSVCFAISCHKNMIPTTPNPDWSDEFEYTGLPDKTKWAYDTGGHGWENQEPPCMYSDIE